MKQASPKMEPLWAMMGSSGEGCAGGILKWANQRPTRHNLGSPKAPKGLQDAAKMELRCSTLGPRWPKLAPS